MEWVFLVLVDLALIAGLTAVAWFVLIPVSAAAAMRKIRKIRREAEAKSEHKEAAR